MRDLDIYSVIDHTELSEAATEEEIDAACETAARFGCASVCVRPEWVKHAAMRLAGATRADGLPVGITTVIDFPHGNSLTSTKVEQTARAIAAGATEVDLVMNIEAALVGNWEQVAADIAAVREASLGATLKIIIESAVLDDRSIVRACLIAVDQGADYVKTSTGYHSAGGATVHDVALMAATVPSGVGVKGSGGLRTKADIVAVLDAGATRIGTSATERLESSDYGSSALTTGSY